MYHQRIAYFWSGVQKSLIIRPLESIDRELHDFFMSYGHNDIYMIQHIYFPT